LIAGGIIGNQSQGDQGENVIKGALLGGVALGLTSYVIHHSLEKRDQRVRRDTLMNLERYEVYGFDGVPKEEKIFSGKCFTTQYVDGEKVMIPCSLLRDGSQN